MDKLTLCSLVFNNVEYLLYQEKICRKLANFDYQRLILDSSKNVDTHAKLLSLDNTVVVKSEHLYKFKGSEAHGIAVNQMMDLIETPYAIILDLDIVPLVKFWDCILLNNLKNNIDVIGIPWTAPLSSRFFHKKLG